MTEQFTPEEQLRLLIERYPRDQVDIRGVVLDYLARTSRTLCEVLVANPRIYNVLFEQSPEDGRQLISSISSFDREGLKLGAECREKFPLVFSPIQAVEGGTHMSTTATDSFSSFGYKIKPTVVWQFSDIHFGRLNKVESSPRELAYTIGAAIKEAPALKPDVVIVSGDTSSTAMSEEFRDFRTFCKEIGEIFWGTHKPSRLLVIPGNHDVTWTKDGKADRMRAFARHVAEAGVCITPFGPEVEEFEGGEVEVRRFLPEAAQVPPIALVSYPKLDLEAVLLVSGYFSGEVPTNIRHMLREVSGDRETLLNLLRVDNGGVNREYIFRMRDLPPRILANRIAVTHHNPVQYGTECCTNPVAPLLLETLKKVGVPVVLHGHIHLTEDVSSTRPVTPKQAYPLPCTSLCAECVSGSRGFSIHLMAQIDEGRVIDTLQWDLGQNRAFEPERLRWRYRAVLEPNGLHVAARDARVLSGA